MKILLVQINKLFLIAMLLVSYNTFGMEQYHTLSSSNESKVAWVTFGSPVQKNTLSSSNESKVAWVTFGSPVQKNTLSSFNESKVAWVTFGNQMK